MRRKLNLPLWLSRFKRHQAGVGAIEFAIVAPVLLLLFLGGSELGIALTIDRKVKAAAGYTVDLVSQSTSLSETDLRKLFGISKSTLAPYSIATLKMRITQIKVIEGVGIVDWSCQSRGYDKLQRGTPVAVPPNLQIQGSEFSFRRPFRMDHEKNYAAIRGGNTMPDPLGRAVPQRAWNGFKKKNDDLRQMGVTLASFQSGSAMGYSPRTSEPQSERHNLKRRLYSHVPNQVKTPSTSAQSHIFYVLRGEASYQYQPLTTAVFQKDITLSGITYSFPRYSSSVVSDGCSIFDL